MNAVKLYTQTMIESGLRDGKTEHPEALAQELWNILKKLDNWIVGDIHSAIELIRIYKQHAYKSFNERQ